jgi:prepilin-type N-terminal cleavage/methylation domain-containing protein
MSITRRSRGFTLIELLVVIAIIGILSAVVLASLSTARSKGQDAAVQSNLSTIQTEAELYYGGNGGNSYGAASATCFPASGSSLFLGDTTIVNAIKSAKSSAAGGVINCQNSTTAYAVQGELSNPATPTTYWCVDSTGKAGTSTTALSTTACP